MQFTNLLIIEDNEGDIELTLEACHGITNLNVFVVKDGDEALDYLYRKADHKFAKQPDVILLDLNLPGTDGRELLKKIKNDKKLRHIPTIINSSSTDPADIEFSYQNNANAYMPKPLDGSGYISHIEAMVRYWTNICKLHKVNDDGPIHF